MKELPSETKYILTMNSAILSQFFKFAIEEVSDKDLNWHHDIITYFVSSSWYALKLHTEKILTFRHFSNGKSSPS